MITETDFIIRIFAAFVLGGLIGFERRTKAAGIRTFILIVLGAAAFTMVGMLPALAGQNQGFDPSRIVSQIIVGIGFIGAGVIWKHHNEFSGITTAATIWAAAAVGMLVGVGELALAMALTLFVMVILYSKRFTASLESNEDEYLQYQAKGMHVLGRDGRKD